MAEPTTTTENFSVSAKGDKPVTFTDVEKAQIERDARRAHNAHMAENFRLTK
jgi:hypothetical protein